MMIKRASKLLLIGALATGCSCGMEMPADGGGGGDDGGPMGDGGGTDAGPPNEAPDGVIDTPAMSVTINIGESVDFAGTCTDPEGMPTTSAWDFGGGAAASTMEDPGAVTFDASGAYTITFTCTDEMGLDDPTPATIMVAVNAPTMATIDMPAADVVIEPGETVTFEGSCTDPEGDTMLTHAWDFMGGAAASTDEDPGAVMFDTAGTYVVTYTCTDSTGGVGTAMITVTVSTRPDGVIDTPAGPTTIPSGGAVDFTATCTDADGDTAFTHAWDFDGGATASTMEDPGAVTFLAAGTYTVTYTCTDSTGLADSTPATVVIRVVDALWAPIVGELTADAQRELVLVDILGPTPGAPVSPFAAWPATADIPSTTQTSVSSTGRYLAFTADVTTDTSDDLYVVDLDSLTPTAVNLTSLAAGRDVESFLFSPDGLKIAYNADVTTLGEDELYIVDLTTGVGTATTVRAHDVLVAGGDVYPTGNTNPLTLDDWAWSANSTKIYFRGDVITNGIAEGFMFDLTAPAAGAQRLHPALAAGGFSVDAVHAAGNDIVILAGDLDLVGAVDIYAVDTSGAPGAPVRLSPTAATTTQELASGFPAKNDIAVSPDGSRVVYRGDYDLGGSEEIWYVDLTAGVPAAGTGVKVNVSLTSSASDVTAFVWAPTGNRFIWRGDPLSPAEELFLVDASGAVLGASTRLHAVATAIQDVDNFTWAPDGSGVVYDADHVTDGVDELFYVALPVGGAPATPVVVNPALVTGGNADGVVIWLTPTTLVYAADQATNAVNEIWLADVTAPGAATRLNAPIAAAGFTVGFFSNAMTTSGDGRILARGDWQTDNITEAVLMDPAAPGTTVALHPALTGFQDINQIVGEP